MLFNTTRMRDPHPCSLYSEERLEAQELASSGELRPSFRMRNADEWVFTIHMDGWVTLSAGPGE